MFPYRKLTRFFRKLNVFTRRVVRRLTQDAFTPSGTLKDVLFQARGTALRYVRDIQWGYQKPGFDVFRAAWQLGWPGRLGLIALILSTLGSAVSMSMVASQDGRLETIGLTFSLAMFAIGWALALTAAAEHSLGAYVIASAYLIWYGSFIGGSLAGTVFFALPSLWTLFVSGQTRPAPARGNWFWQLLLCLGAGYLTFNTLGFGRFVSPEWYNIGRMALGCIYFGLLELQKRIIRPWATTNWIFWGTLIVTGGFFLLATGRDPESMAANTTLSFSGILGLVSFFWLWMGGSFFQDMLWIGEWGAGETSRWLGRWVGWLIPAIWLGTAFWGWLSTYPLPLGITVWLNQAGFYAWVDSWSLAHYFTVHALPVIGLLILLVWMVYTGLIRQQPSSDALGRLNSLWIAASLILLGFFENMEAFSTLETDAIPEFSFWPILVLLGGLWWDIATSSAEWADASEQRLKATLAFTGLMLSISIGLVAAGSAELVLEYTLFSFLGLIYLGLPLSIYTLLQTQERYEPVPGNNLALLFGLGCFSALVGLKISPNAGWHLIVAPGLWSIILLTLGKKLGRLESSLDGAVAGVALAFGFVAFWMSPQIVPIPFLGFLQDWQMSYLSEPLNRPLLQAGHLWLTLTSLGIGIVIGWAFTPRFHLAMRIIIITLCLLAFAWLTPQLPGMPGP